MKRKILILVLSVISAMCICFALSACGGETYSTLVMEEGIVYLTDFSVKYTSDEESPYGDISESSLEEEKYGTVQSYYLVMNFDMQTVSDIPDIEYLTIELTVLDADIVDTTINYANTSLTDEKTLGSQATITASYSLPDKAKLVKNVQLVVELKPKNEGATDIVYSFSTDSKEVIGYESTDITFFLTSSAVTIGKTSLEYTLNEDGDSYTVTGIGGKSGGMHIEETYKDKPVTAIGEFAFYECTSVTSVVIGDSVTYIDHLAFYNCTSLTSITIPDSVTSIGDGAFHGCTALTSIAIGDGVTSIGEYAFRNTAYYNKSSNWENDVLYIGNHLIVANRSISGEYSIKDGTLTIGESAFNGCTSLASVTIGDSVTHIGLGAFYKCTSLASVTIGDSVSYIDGSAFENCTSLTSVVIPDSVTSIGGFAFYNCTSLTSVTIGDSVTHIGWGAFYKCTSLKSVTFKNTSGWYVTQTEGASSGIDVNVTDASTNATYLTSTYCNYYWYRSES